ncbi:hypothetical protein BsWGS_28936 [Bradybaena similaris]
MKAGLKTAVALNTTRTSVLAEDARQDLNMSNSFGSFDSYPNNGSYLNDEELYDEHEEEVRRAQVQAMHEAAAEFSPFESSSSEEDDEEDTNYDVENMEDNHDSGTEQDHFQVALPNPPVPTSSPTDASRDMGQAVLNGLFHQVVPTHQAFPSVATPGSVAASTDAMTSSREASVMTTAAPSRQVTPASRELQNVQHTFRNSEVNDGGDCQFSHYKVNYHKPDLDTLDEEQFYIDNENVEFLRIDGPEDHRTYEQLEILYRARGREIEELTRRLDEKDEEKSKEIRNLKHRLAIASGQAEAVSESQHQCQLLLQQSKADNSEASAKIRTLEAQVMSLRDTKEELIKKLQTAESTIENMTRHIEELQASESLSRARNEHEAAIASLTSRYERELLIVREKLDTCKTALEAKQEELVHVKKQLADATRELEQTQVSKAETVNRLNRSLEESQRQCQAILEQSSSHEVSMLKAQLQQVAMAKRVSEEQCQTLQRDIQQLKEQLNMFESASQLGVFPASSRNAHAPCHDDSISDLGIRKTLNFSSPQTVARQDGNPAAKTVTASLKSELEKCLYSNRQLRSEAADRVQQIHSLKEELQEAHSRVTNLEKNCADQKARLEELDSLNKPGDRAVTAVEARLRREIEDLKRNINALLADNEDYKTRLQEVGDSEAKLTEINAELSQQIAQMVNDFDLDKQSALQSCQRTMEAVNRHSFDKLRQEIEERFQSEKAMLMDDSKRKLDNLNQVLTSTQTELDSVKALYVRTCEENSRREAELKDSYRMQMEEEVRKTTDKLEKEKREWESFMRAKMEKEQTELKNSFRQTDQASQDKLASEEKQQLAIQAEREEILANARKQWDKEHERDVNQWTEEKNVYESELSSRNDELCEYKRKLDLKVSEMEKLMKHAEDLELDHKINMMSLEKKHKEEINDIVVKYDRKMLQVEEKLVEMFKEFAISVASKLGSAAKVSDSFQNSDVLGKLQFLWNIFKEKDFRLQELEKVLQEQKAVVLSELSKNNSKWNGHDRSFVDFEYYCGDLTEASSEKLIEHIKKLESVLHTMKQKYIKDINELKQQHQKEFENASRLREDKFQAELRYFLNEKEDQCKMRMETAVKQCESTAKLQQEQALKEAAEKHESFMHETICKFESKKAELQKIIDEYEKGLNKVFKPSESTSAEDTFSLRDKMKHEICLLEEKYMAEKSALERKLKQLEEEKDDEIVNLCLRQAEEERSLKDKFDSDLASLKMEHQNVVRKLELELSLQKSDAVKANGLIELLKKEIESNKLVVERLRNEIEQTKASLTSTQSLPEQIKEHRAKWFQEAQEYINKDIKQGVQDNIKKEEENMKEKLEKIKKEEEMMRKKLEKVKEEDERMKKEQKNIKEWGKEKELFEREKAEEVREKIQLELENLNKRFGVELNARVEKIKSQLEHQKTVWQEEERKKLMEEREKIIQALRSHMERTLQEAKTRLEMKMEKEKQDQLREIQNEMQEEMRKRMQNMREEWKREREENENRDTEELTRLKECLQVEVDDRIKAIQERDAAIDYLKQRDLLFREEEQRLILGLKKSQEDLEEVSKRHEAVVEQVNNIDRKYKANLKKLKTNNKQELAELKAKHAEEKDSLMTLFRAHYDGDLEKVRKRGEQERAALIQELERVTMISPLPAKIPFAGARTAPGWKTPDHNLDTAASRPADRSAHLHSTHIPMPAPVIGREIIDIFKAKVKENVRSALSQKVQGSIITTLEQSLDVLSEHIKSMAARETEPASDMPSSGKHNSRQQLDDDALVGSKQASCPACSHAFSKGMAVFDKHLQQFHHSHHTHKDNEELLEEQRSHPQLGKYDPRDSDWNQHFSSPANPGCTRSFKTPASNKQHITASYVAQLSPNVAADTRTIPTKLEANYSDECSLRDERKFVEARVRLVNWAQTGEMPWKSSPDMSGLRTYSADGYIKPGLDSQQWVGKQRDNSNFLTSTSRNVTNRDQRCCNLARVHSDSSMEFCVSSQASTSFVTLKTDDTD